jgi:hypothetical protein
MDDWTDDGTDGWKGGPTPTNTTGQTDTTNIIMVEIEYSSFRDFGPPLGNNNRSIFHMRIL